MRRRPSLLIKRGVATKFFNPLGPQRAMTQPIRALRLPPMVWARCGLRRCIPQPFIGIWGDSHTASGSFMDAMLQAWGFPTEGMRAGHVQAAMDLGTGSGAIALAFKHHRPNVQMHARDLSADALDVARANAQRLDLEIAFSQGAWLEGFTETFDAIVSNPPYIAEADPHLLALRHEPVQALTSGADGLNDLRAIITQAPVCLKPGGWLLLEHGYDQGEAVRQLLQAKGFVAVQSRKDLEGIERCSGGRCAARTDI